MDPTDIGLFRLAERRLAWVDQRQSLLAQNIANANTPGYQARDLPSFASALAAQDPTLTTTDPAHLPGRTSVAAGKVERGHNKAPNGNSVSMEEQLGKVADTSSTQDLVTSLYHKYQGMFRVVLGKSG